MMKNALNIHIDRTDLKVCQKIPLQICHGAKQDRNLPSSASISANSPTVGYRYGKLTIKNPIKLELQFDACKVRKVEKTAPS